MLLFLLEAVLTIALLAAPLSAAPQDDWIFPANPDQTSSLVSGEKYTVKWNSNLKNWFAEYCDACDTQNVDLWILGGNNFHKLSSGINVETTLSYTWTADIPSSELNVDLWVFRFLASGVEFEGTQTQSIASPIFFLREGDGNSETTVGPTSTTKTADNPTVESVNTKVEETTKTNVVEVTKTKEETVKTEATTEKTQTKADASSTTKATETSVAVKATSTIDPKTTTDKTSLSSSKLSSFITASSSPSSSSTSAAFDPINTASETDTALSPHGTASPNSKDASSNSGLSKAAMIGIGVGVAVGAAICCLLGFFCFQRRRHKRNNPPRGISPLTLKRGLSSHDGEVGPPINARGYGAAPRTETAQSFGGMTGLGSEGHSMPTGIGAAGWGAAENQDATARLGTAHTHDSNIGAAVPLQPEAAAAALPGTWIYDRRTAMLKELQGDEVRAVVLEHMPLPELPASPVAAELPTHGHGR
ncbi:trans-aconitate methyltransferase 1 [Hypoxylon texense]